MLILAILLSAVLSYLLGSFNSSILVVRLLKHKDIRDYGSHNAGLTNTLRCFGKGCAALTLVGDLAKGIIAVLLSRGICELLHTGLTAQNDVHFIGYIAGIFAILGHVFPLYYHFKGGKGVLVGVFGLSGNRLESLSLSHRHFCRCAGDLEVRFPRLYRGIGLLSHCDVSVPVLAAWRPAHVVSLAQHRAGGAHGCVGHLDAPHQYPAAQSRERE